MNGYLYTFMATYNFNEKDALQQKDRDYIVSDNNCYIHFLTISLLYDTIDTVINPMQWDLRFRIGTILI